MTNPKDTSNDVMKYYPSAFTKIFQDKRDKHLTTRALSCSVFGHDYQTNGVCQHCNRSKLKEPKR